MLLIRFEGGLEPDLPQELELSVRERNSGALFWNTAASLPPLLRGWRQ